MHGSEFPLELRSAGVPKMSLRGLESQLSKQVYERYPDIVCLMLSGHRERSYVRRSLEAGARGFILKGKPGELSLAIETVMSGGTYLSEAVNVFGGDSKADRA